MIFFLYGEDTYRSRQKLNLIKERFLVKDKSRLNLVQLDGAKIDYKDLRKELTASPFLHDKKLVVIDNLLSENKQEKVFEELGEMVKNKSLPDFMFVIFWEGGKVDKRKSFFKILQKEAQVEEFVLLVNNQINQWIMQEVKSRGGVIDFPAVNQLVLFAGNDLWQLSNEIDKLLAYNQQITLSNVNLLVNAKANDNIFALMDAISVKNKKQAMILLAQQLEDVGNDVTYLLNMLVRQFRILIQLKNCLAEKMLTSQIATTLKLHPFVVQKTLPQVKNFEVDQLKNIYEQLMEIDYKIKTSAVAPEVLLELLVAEM